MHSLRKRFNETGISKVPTEFVLKNNYFEFNENVCKQISGTAIGTKLVLPYACIFMDKMKTSFLKKKKKITAVQFDLDILMTYFLYEHMVKNNLIYFSKILTTIIQTCNLHTKYLRIVLIF